MGDQVTSQTRNFYWYQVPVSSPTPGVTILFLNIMKAIFLFLNILYFVTILFTMITKEYRTNLVSIVEMRARYSTKTHCVWSVLCFPALQCQHLVQQQEFTQWKLPQVSWLLHGVPSQSLSRTDAAHRNVPWLSWASTLLMPVFLFAIIR